MDEKFALLFWSEFSIGNGEFHYQVTNDDIDDDHDDDKHGHDDNKNGHDIYMFMVKMHIGHNFSPLPNCF